MSLREAEGAGVTTVLRCDRCGREVEFRSGGRAVYLRDAGPPFAPNDRWVDLCESCVEDLRRFISNGRKEES
jgi:hypothetical protein